MSAPTPGQRLGIIIAFLAVFGGMAPLVSATGPAIGGLALAVTVAMAELLGAVLCGWAILVWQGKL